MDVVLNADASNLPVALQDLGIDVLAGLGGVQDGVDDEAAEIDLSEKLAMPAKLKGSRVYLHRARR